MTPLHLRFDARTYPDPAARAAAWRDAMAASAVPTLTDDEARTLDGRLDLFPLGTVLLARIAATPQIVRRDRALLARLPYGHVIFDVFLDGGCRGVVGAGKRVSAGPGDGVLFDLRRTMDLRMTAFRLHALVMPRDLLGTRAGPVGDVDGVVLRAETPQARLLASTMAAAVEQAPRLDERAAAALGIGLANLVGTCIAGVRAQPARRGRPATPAPSVARLRRHVERHAADPAFDPARLAAAFDLSRTALYRAFGDEGGVAAAIRTCRLARATRLLREAAWGGQSIEAVAQASGFASGRGLRRALHDAGMASPRLLRANPASGVGLPSAPMEAATMALFEDLLG